MNEEELYNDIVEKLSSGDFLQLNGKAINLSELNDYINAQQQEIERLKKCYCNRSDCAGRLNQKNEVYDSVVQRNERAIEYIEQHNDFFLLKREVKKLLDILKGVDKE